MVATVIRRGGGARLLRFLVRRVPDLMSAHGRQRIRDGIAYLYRRSLHASDDPYLRWVEAAEPPSSGYDEFRRAASAWPRRPLISVLMPVYETPERFLREAIDSVLRQTYPDWELCIADDASRSAHVRSVLREYAERDRRIRLTFRTHNGHISEASNSALALASGQFVALLDHDDLLHPLALHWVAREIARNPEANLVFTDEDRIDESGVRHDPYFKSAFNYELFLAHNMVCHLGSYRRGLVVELGGFRAGLEGAQDWDLALRVVERSSPGQIAHVPRVLYHWRALPGSAAWGSGEKPYAAPAGRRAVADHLSRVGRDADVIDAPEAPGMNRVRYGRTAPLPRVSIVVCRPSGEHLAATWLQSIQDRTAYPDREVVIADDGLPAATNRAVQAATGEFVCLLRAGVEILTPDWVEEMLSFASQPDVGAVGARLWYRDDTLQHGGIILGVGAVAGYAHRHLRRGLPGYFGRAVLHQSLSAVSADCLMIRRRAYQAVGGLDEGLGGWNDVDLCLRVRRAGYRNVWTPYAEMIHPAAPAHGSPRADRSQQDEAAAAQIRQR